MQRPEKALNGGAIRVGGVRGSENNEKNENGDVYIGSEEYLHEEKDEMKFFGNHIAFQVFPDFVAYVQGTKVCKVAGQTVMTFHNSEND